MPETYIVTGGAGFIGSHIAERLLKDGHRVRIIDNFCTGKRENLAHLTGDLEVHETSITDGEALKPIFAGVDYVFHQAALASVPRSVDDPLTSHEFNVTGTLNVLIAARDAGVKRVIYAASSSAYGDIEGEYKVETMPPAPLSPYGVSKLAGEYYCQAFTAVYGLETVALRYFNVFGPRQDPGSQYSGVVSRFISSLLSNERPMIYGDGEQSRDVTYIDNVVFANVRAAEAKDAAGKVINVANGERITLNQLLAELKELTGKQDVTAEYLEPRVGDVRHSLADISMAQKFLGYESKVGLNEGLKRIIDWWKSSRFNR